MCFHDECLLSEYQKRFPKQQITFWPDASDELPPNPRNQQCAEITSKAKGRFIIASVGVMDRRKGIITLLRAAHKMPDCFFVFAGPDIVPGSFTKEERQAFENASRNCPENCYFHLDRIHDDRDFNSFINVSDALYVAYLGHTQSSNILTKAAVLKKPVIVSDRPGCLELRNRTYNLGIEVSEGCVRCTMEAIATLRQQRDDGILHHDRRYDDFLKAHSQEAMAQKLLSVVEKLATSRN